MLMADFSEDGAGFEIWKEKRYQVVKHGSSKLENDQLKNTFWYISYCSKI